MATPDSAAYELEQRGWLDGATSRKLLEAYRSAGDPNARQRLIEAHLPLVEMLARRYSGRGEQLEDLVQVGAIGLILAVDRFDPCRGGAFLAFAVPTVVGEIKKHLRDRSSTVRLPRRLHELSSQLRRPQSELTSQLHRAPTAAEIARVTGVREDEVVQVQFAEQSRVSLPLQGQEGWAAGCDEGTNDGDAYDAVDDRVVIMSSLRLLNRRERRIVHLRFSLGMSQAEIARALGISQVHVSRLLRGALAKVRARLDDASSPAAPQIV